MNNESLSQKSYETPNDPWADAVDYAPEDPWASTLEATPNQTTASNEVLASPESNEKVKRSLGRRVMDRLGIKKPETTVLQEPSSEQLSSPWDEAVQPPLDNPWESVDLTPVDVVADQANESLVGSVGPLEHATAEQDASYMKELRDGGRYDNEGTFTPAETNYNRELQQLTQDHPELSAGQIQQRYEGRLSEAKSADVNNLYLQEQQYAQRQAQRTR